MKKSDKKVNLWMTPVSSAYVVPDLTLNMLLSIEISFLIFGFIVFTLWVGLLKNWSHLISWLKIGSPAGQRTRSCHHVFCGNIAARGQVLVLPLYLQFLKRLITALGTYCRQRATLRLSQNQLSDANHLADVVCQSCAKTAAHAGRAWRRPSPLAAATAISSPASVLAQHLKLFSGLWLMK